MNRNDYRRAFIMLRSVLPGYGGHARLERRTLTGSLYFIVTAPQGVNELSAALVGQRGGEYYAAPVGPLARDRRGQLTLAWAFDPRSVAGRPLEAYAWVAVLATGGPCALALTGNLEGSRPMDPRKALEAACAAAFPRETAPAADLPQAGEPREVPAEPAVVETPEPVVETPEPAVETPEPAVQPEMKGDVRVYTRSRVRRLRAARRRLEAEASEEALAQESAGEAVPEAFDPATPPAEVPAVEAPVTAAHQLGLDITRPWPGPAEALRRWFATLPPADAPLGDGFTYIYAPMPGGSGYPGSLAGLKAGDGRVVALRYALPARRAPEPPAGLEDSRWVGVGGEEGYWVTEEAVGEPDNACPDPAGP